MRRRSLRRQWNAAFAAMLALSLGVGLAGTAGVYVLAEQTRDGADEVHRELMLLSELRNALTTEERLAHEYLNGPYAAGSFQDADDATGAILREMRSAFDDADELTETGIIEIQWDEAFASFRVPGGPDRTRSGPGHTALGVDMGVIELSLNRLEMASAAEVSRDSAAASRAQTQQTLRLAAFLAATVAIILYCGRRLGRQVLGPLDRLQKAAVRLGRGELDERVVVERDDEIGDVAAAFNTMAAAISAGAEELRRQAFHDPLTGLANRALLHSRTEHALDRQARTGGDVGLILLDLDDFKRINDTLGHRAGDMLLKDLADRLQRCTRTSDTLARLGGDEFAVLLEHLSGRPDAVSAAERILAALSSPFDFEGRSLPISASLGVSIVGPGCASVDDLVRNADVAMYVTKDRGKGDYTVFESGMRVAAPPPSRPGAGAGAGAVPSR